MIPIPFHILKQCFEHGQQAYPEEACGIISGPKEAPHTLETVHFMKNVMDDYHAQDPQTHTRTNKDAYLMDPQEHARLLRQLKKSGQCMRVIFHTHPDVGAYFSDQDISDALWNGEPLHPNVVYLVCGITQGQPDGAILAFYSQHTQRFQTMPVFPFPIQTTDSSNAISNTVLGGDFGVTAHIETIDDIVAWQEGNTRLQHGYFRFVEPQALQVLQHSIACHYDVRHCLAYTSAQAAYMELLDYLLLSKPEMRITVWCDLLEDSIVWPLKALPHLNTTIRHISSEDELATSEFSNKKDEIVLLALKDPQRFYDDHVTWLEGLKKQRVARVLLTDHWMPQTLVGNVFEYGVMPLNLKESQVQGGILISQVDRHVSMLEERRKQTGPVLCARDAAFFLGKFSTEPEVNASSQVIDRLCELEKAKHGFLYPSGMNAIASLFALLRQPGKSQIIAIGHMYADTYQLLTYAKLRHIAPDNVFLDVSELDELESHITPQTCAIITEAITNPLGEVADLQKIHDVAKNHQLPVIVDNTLPTPVNAKPLEQGATFVIHSTTKYLGGQNDHAGGAIVLNDEQYAHALKQQQQAWGSQMSLQEANVLWERLQDFETRMQRFNQNALEVALFLEEHPKVAQVHFCGLDNHPHHDVVQKQFDGAGAVVSFTLAEETLEALKRFYDGDIPNIHKAPSLGSNETLICPYTLLAHYHESDEVLQSMYLSRMLLRVAVGSEKDITPVLDGLMVALGRV